MYFGDTIRKCEFLVLVRKLGGGEFCNSQYDNGVKEKTKGQLCKDLEIDFFIDDSITNVQNTHEAGVTTFLFDAPWNRDFVHTDIVRVRSWKEIEEILLK